jgi:hypothetical protein
MPAASSRAVDGAHAPVVVAIAADACASCGVHLAPDQRYCVECGHARRATSLPSFVPTGVPDDPARAGGHPRAGRRPRRLAAWRSPDATVFAVVGSLLLAMGVGVLIGRADGRTGTSVGPARVTTVVLSGSGAATGALAPTPAASTSAQGTTGAATIHNAKKSAAKQAPPTRTTVPKPVHVGSSGTGPGYQKGKFTGNFFGGGG